MKPTFSCSFRNSWGTSSWGEVFTGTQHIHAAHFFSVISISTF
jgi:hypothetical protein